MHFTLRCADQLLDLRLVARLLAGHKQQVADGIEGIVNFVRNGRGQTPIDT